MERHPSAFFENLDVRTGIVLEGSIHIPVWPFVEVQQTMLGRGARWLILPYILKSFRMGSRSSRFVLATRMSFRWATGKRISTMIDNGLSL